MATAAIAQMTDYEIAVAWQVRSMEIAERDGLEARRDGYGAGYEKFTVPSRSRRGLVHRLTLYTAGAHNGQLHCTCEAHDRGLCCGHAGAVLNLLSYEQETAATWLEATAGYQEERF